MKSQHVKIRLTRFCTFLFLTAWMVVITAAPATAQQRTRNRTTTKKKTPKPKPTQNSRRTTRPTRRTTPSSKSGEPNINPDLERKFDELMKNEQRPGSRSTRTSQLGPRRTIPKPKNSPNTRNTGRKSTSANPAQSNDPAGPTVAINIPASPQSNIPPEQRTYGFSIKDGTYEQLVAGFARQTGMGVLGAAPKDGNVTFITTEELTFDEALSRIRMLLFSYKPHEPYWIEKHDTHLAVVRVTDIYRVIPRNRMFQSINQLRDANISDEELVLVIYTPKKGSISDLKEVRDFLPDYIRVTPLKDNRVSIFALNKDIDKYLWLIDFFAGKRSDPRSLERIKIKFIPPSLAIEKLRQLIPDLESSKMPGRPRPTPRRGADAIDTMPEPDVVIIPEDSKGYLLVRAMQDKIEEIKLMLPFVDMKSSMGSPVIIPVEYADVNDLISTISQILILSAPVDGTTSSVKPGARSRRPVKAAAGDPVTTHDVTLFAHPSGRSIIVIARNEEIINRVRSLVEQFDEPIYVGPERIELKFANPGDVVTTLTAILGPSNKGKPSSERLHIVADPAGNAIWFTSNHADAKKVRDIIAGLDTPSDEIKLHTIELKNQLPSFVASMLKQYDSSKAGAGGTSVKGRAKRVTKPVTVSKFTANDENNRLFVLCTEEDWQTYLPLINKLEQLIDEQDPYVRLEVQHIDPQRAVDRLTEMIGIASGPKGPIRIIAAKDAVLVIGATVADVKNIRAYMVEIDKDTQIVQRTFILQFASPEDIKTAIETLIGTKKGITSRRTPSTGKAGKGGFSATDELIIFPIGSRIVVRTTPELMAKVEQVVNEFDVEEASIEIRVYEDFPPGANIDAISATLSSFASVTIPGKGGKSRSTGKEKDVGPKFIPQQAAGKLIIMAEPAAFPSIERLLEVLKFDVDFDPINVKLIPVEHVDPTELVELIGPMIDMKVHHMVSEGLLKSSDDITTLPTSGARKARARSTGSQSERYHMTADERNHRIVIAAPQPIIEITRELIAQFDIPAETPEVIFRTIELSNANASDMVRAIREMRGTIKRRTSKPGSPGVKTFSDRSDTLIVVEAPGGKGVVLHGPMDKLEETAAWIKQLDNQSSGGQLIKVFEIKHADIRRLVELILNVVDSPAIPTKGKAKRPAKRASLDNGEDMFETNKTWHGQSIYIQADLIASTMIVATSESKMNRIEDIIIRFDSEEAIGIDDTPLPKRVFELQFVDSFDASWELESVLGEVWEPSDDLPTVTSMMSSNSLIVKYHDASRFDEIEDIIKRFVDKLSPEEKRIGKKSYAPPKGLSAEEVALWFQMNHPEIDIEIINIAEKKVVYDIERVTAPKPGRRYPCVLPGAFYHMTQTVITGAIGQQKKRSSDDMIRSILPGSKKDSNKTEKSERNGAKRILTGEKLKAYYDSEQGIIIVEGKQALLEDVDDWMDELKEEIENLPVKLDIRIYRVKYIGVYEAREIIEEMFNATRQQRSALQAAQRRQQQQAQRQQQIARQRQQQQQNRGGQSDQQNRQRGQQQAGNVPQLPKEAVRIFANPRDRTLIFRAETSQYPAIEELLATIDQPKPIDSEMRIFKLVKLDALEVEDILKNLLGLSGKRTKAAPAPQSGARGAAGRNARSRSRQSSSKQLPQTIMQEVVGKTGVLGVDPEDINITSNEAANSILVMAPKAAIEYIDQIIKELEDMPTDGDEMRTITLQYATPSKLAETIENALSRGKKNKKGKPTGDTRFTLTPHDETKQLFVSARDEMFVRIEKMVTILDQPQQIGFEMKIYPLKHADARKIHEQMTSLMTDYLKRLGKKANTMEPFSVEVDDTMNSLIVMGSPSVFEFIEKNLAMVDTPANASSPPSIKIYPVHYADPGTVANIINQWSKSRTQGGGRSSKVSSSNQVIAAAESVTQSVVISASETNHAIVQKLITDLDVAPEGQGVYVLKIENADAQSIAQTLQAIFVQTTQRRGGAQKISISSTPGSTSITVKCSDEVLRDIKEVVAQLDTEGINQPKIIALKFAKVGQVLPTLQDMFSSQRGGGGRSGKMQPVINGNEAINAIIVRAESSDLSAIESVIASLDTQEAADKPSFRLIQVKSGINVTSLAEKIERAINEGVRGRPSSGNRGSAASISATPDVRTGTIIIAGTPTLFDEAEKLITALQEMGPSGGRVTRVIPISNVGIDDVRRLIDQLTGDSSSGGRSRRATGSRSSGSRRSGSSRSQRRPRTPSSPRRGRP